MYNQGRLLLWFGGKRTAHDQREKQTCEVGLFASGQFLVLVRHQQETYSRPTGSDMINMHIQMQAQGRVPSMRELNGAHSGVPEVLGRFTNKEQAISAFLRTVGQALTEGYQTSLHRRFTGGVEPVLEAGIPVHPQIWSVDHQQADLPAQYRNLTATSWPELEP